MEVLDREAVPAWVNRASAILMQGSPDKCADPLDPQWWLRHIPADDDNLPAGMSLGETMDLHQRHLSFIAQETDIAVPRYEYKIVGQGARERLYIRTAVVHGLDLDVEPDSEQAAQPPIPASFQEPLRHVAAGLHVYFTWAIRHEGRVLSDIASSRQYILGRAGYELDERPQLVDLDPYYAASDVYSFTWYSQMQQLRSWAGKLGMREIVALAEVHQNAPYPRKV
jgi:hypothetical protein